MEPLSQTAVPQPTAGYELEELDGDLLLFDPQSGELVQANATAAIVWGLCDGCRTVAEISDLLAAAYPAQSEDVRADVPRIIADLVRLDTLFLAT